LFCVGQGGVCGIDGAVITLWNAKESRLAHTYCGDLLRIENGRRTNAPIHIL
jgi:hypothetical protein